MDFCIGTCAKIDQVDLVPLAEDLGITHFGVGEGPLLFSDPYQFLALAATQTSTIRLGTMVTNPLTRIAPVTANSMATLNALAPGRTFLGIGTANNALRSMGNRPATIAELTHAVVVTRELMAGRRVVHNWLGQHREVEFLDTESGFYNVRDDIPIWVSAGGPRGLAAAAKYADAVVYCLGPNENHDRPGPAPTRQSGRGCRTSPGLGETRRAGVVLPTGARRDVGGRCHQRLWVGPDFVMHHQFGADGRASRRRSATASLTPRSAPPGSTWVIRRHRINRTTWTSGPSTCVVLIPCIDRSSPKSLSTTGACTGHRPNCARRPR